MNPVYYMASQLNHARFIWTIHNSLLFSITQLKSPSAIREVNHWAANGARIMIDSGVFEVCAKTARIKGISIREALSLPLEELHGFTALREQYVKTAKQLKGLDMLVELDAGGTQSKRDIRAGLEAEGLKVTPVCHPLADGWEYLDELAERYEKICIGNIVDANRTLRIQMLSRLLSWKRRHPGVWLHILGMRPNPILTAFPMDSCDSSSWTEAVRWFAAWTASAMFNRRIGRFPREMAHPREGEACRQHAMQLVAIDEECATRSLANYWEYVA